MFNFERFLPIYIDISRRRARTSEHTNSHGRSFFTRYCGEILEESSRMVQENNNKRRTQKPPSQSGILDWASEKKSQ